MINKVTPIQIAAASAIIFVVVVFILRTRRRGPGGGIVAPSDPTGFRPGFSPEGEAARFAQAFNGWNFWSNPRREALNNLWRMSDDELKAVYNAYNSGFAEPGETMLSVIETDWVFGSEVDRVTNRLKGMGLN